LQINQAEQLIYFGIHESGQASGQQTQKGLQGERRGHKKDLA
jgi:hypothetical protein